MDFMVIGMVVVGAGVFLLVARVMEKCMGERAQLENDMVMLNAENEILEKECELLERQLGLKEKNRQSTTPKVVFVDTPKDYTEKKVKP